MIVTPGPGWLAILLALAILAAEFAWARRLLDRLRKGRGCAKPGSPLRLEIAPRLLCIFALPHNSQLWSDAPS